MSLFRTIAWNVACPIPWTRGSQKKQLVDVEGSLFEGIGTVGKVDAGSFRPPYHEPKLLEVQIVATAWK
jgi:hypothetical protein